MRPLAPRRPPGSQRAPEDLHRWEADDEAKAVPCVGRTRVLLAGLFLTLSCAHTAAGSAALDRGSAGQAARAAFVFQAQDTRNALLEAMDDDLLAQRKRAEALGVKVAALRLQVQRAGSGASAAQESARALAAQLARSTAETAAAQETFEAALAQKDEAYARQLQALRSAADAVLATPDGLRVLELNNSGDWEGVKRIELELRAQRAQARQKAEAADARAFAVLALDNAAKGRETMAAVIGRLEEVTALDPTAFGDWVKLTAFYTASNNLAGALKSANTEVSLAASEAERSEAYGDLGSAQRLRGDLQAAEASYRQGLAAGRRDLARSRGDHRAIRNLMSALANAGGVLTQQGRFSEALTLYSEANLLGKSLIRGPSTPFADLSAAWTVDLDIGRLWLDLPASPPPEAERLAELLVKQVRAAASQTPGVFWLELPLAEGLDTLGRVQSARGDQGQAMTSFKAALAAEDAMLQKDPSFVQAKADCLDVLEDLAGAESATGETAEASAHLELESRYTDELSKTDASNIHHILRRATSDAALSGLRLALGDVDGAEAAAAGSLTAARTLVQRDPHTLANTNALAGALRATAEVNARRGRRAQALADLQQAQTVIDRAGSAGQIHELFAIARDMALLGSKEVSWRQVETYLTTARSAGRLARSDAWMIEDAQAHLERAR